MNKKQLLVTLVISLLAISTSVFAYNEDYPPYKFGKEFKSYFKLQNLDGKKPIYENDDYHYRNKTNSFELIKTNPHDSFSIDGLVIKANNKIILSNNEHPHVTGFFMADIDANGVDDYIVISYSVGNGLLAFAFGRIYLFLGRPDGNFETVYFESIYPSESDFLDIDKDEKCELIIGGFEWVGRHSYWTYSIYEIKNYKLVNVNSKFMGFPKIIWFTHKPNDKDTVRLTQRERASLVDKMDNSIEYGEIK